MAFPDPGTGTTIAFGTSGFAPTVVKMSIGGASRTAIRTTKINPTLPSGVPQTGGHTSKPALIHELGPIRATIQWNPASASRPPMNAVPETVTVTFPDSSTLAGS